MRNNAGKEGAAVAVGKYARWLEPDGLLLLTAWARDGLNDEQIAKKCGIGVRTLYDWKKAHPQISQALTRGKEPYDVEVENALRSRALGYTAPVRKTFKIRRVEYDERGRKIAEYETLEVGIDEVHVPADVNAQKFWLANRKSDVWRDRAQAENKDALERLDRLIGEIDHAAQS